MPGLRYQAEHRRFSFRGQLMERAMISEYSQRDDVLRTMGFCSYSDYLRSDLLRRIRRKALRGTGSKCEVCGDWASHVHHRDYSLATLEGRRTDNLLVVCWTCHKAMEFVGTRKTTLQEANTAAHILAEQYGRTIKDKRKTARACMDCGQTPMKGKARCKRCHRAMRSRNQARANKRNKTASGGC